MEACQTGLSISALFSGIWGEKGQGKTFQTELIFKAMGVEPVVMSAGEMESEWAGQTEVHSALILKKSSHILCFSLSGAPGRLIRERYRTASQVIRNQVWEQVTTISSCPVALNSGSMVRFTPISGEDELRDDQRLGRRNWKIW